MTDYRAMFDSKYISAWDLLDRDGKPRDVIVEIVKVQAAELVSEGNKKSRRPVLSFRGRDKQLVVNKTIGKVMKSLYGEHVEAWIGKSIVLYGTKTRVGQDDNVPCVRVRPTAPQRGPARDEPPPNDPKQHQEEPGAAG